MERKKLYSIVAGAGLAAILTGVGTNIYEKNNDKNTLIPEILYGVGAVGVLSGSVNWSYESRASPNKEDIFRKKGLKIDFEDKYDPDKFYRK